MDMMNKNRKLLIMRGFSTFYFNSSLLYPNILEAAYKHKPVFFPQGKKPRFIPIKTKSKIKIQWIISEIL